MKDVRNRLKRHNDGFVVQIDNDQQLTDAVHHPAIHKSSLDASETTKCRRRPSTSGTFNQRSVILRAILVSIIIVTLATSIFLSWTNYAKDRQLSSSWTAIVPSEPNTALALLYPPGFLGGYRNQVIRLMGWVSYAVEHGYSFLYLPSILWRTQMQQFPNEPWYPIPMESIFDVEYWNQPQFSALPRLVRQIHGSDCWTNELDPSIVAQWSSLHPLQQASLRQGFLRPIANMTQGAIANATLFNPRKVDVMPHVAHCQHPVAYGGGKGAGKLWNDYLAYRSNKTANKHLPKDIDHFILRALRPAERWRSLAEECVAAKHGADYLALHARVEVEMMAHACGKEMNWNLSSIFEQVTDFLAERSENDIGGVFVAVSRDGMQRNISDGPWRSYQPYAQENLETLNRLVGSRGTSMGKGLLDGKVTVFECGKHMMDQFYASHPTEIYYGSLLEQVINFYIAVSAKIFVGVKQSSYSTDVWTTRYYQGRGAANFEYTRQGRIEPVENGGLPNPHGNCARKKKMHPEGAAVKETRRRRKMMG